MFGLDGISGVLSRGVLVLACVVLVIASIDARAQVVCVDATRGRAGASGSCAPGPDGYWSDPFSSLAEALAESSEGEEVWVAAGTYEEEGLALPSRVTLSGGFAGHESSPLERDRWAHRVFVSTPAAAPEPVVLDLLGDARVEEITVFSAEQGAGSGLRVLCAAQRAGGIVSLEGVIARDLREGLLLEMVSGEETQGCEIRARVERCVRAIGVSSQNGSGPGEPAGNLG